MKKNIKIPFLYLGLIFLISLGIYVYYNGSVIFYNGVKYITSTRSIDIMISTVMVTIFYQYFMNSYYYYLLNRNNIIVRVGRIKYAYYIIKKIILSMFLFFLTNLISDFVITKRIDCIYNLVNTIFIGLVVILLPKRKEYNYELMICLLITMILRILFFLARM